MPVATSNGIELYYEVQGEGSPVLLIMGTGSDHTTWGPIPSLVSERHRCISFDSRGTGLSSKPERGYSAAIMAEDARGLLDALGIPVAHVWGWSLGASAAQELAISHPERVASMLLCATWDRPWPHLRRRFELQSELAKLGRRDLLTAFAALTLFSSAAINADEQEVSRIQARLYSSTDESDAPTTPVHALLGHYDADITHHTADRLWCVKCPTLVLCGRDDPLTLVAYAEVVQQAIAGAQLTIVDHEDHMLPLARPELVAEIGLQFVSEVERQTPQRGDS